MRIVSIVGARPQFVKAAVLRKKFLDRNHEEILIHTGQHYDLNMSDVFFKELDMRPAEIKFNLENRSHGGMTGEILPKIEEVLLKNKPDLCVVYGDTNSTLAGALAAAKIHIPVCHVEAGLRSFNKKMPEEINRIMTDHVSDYLFCSTYDSVKNLKDENITSGVHHVGDIMYDAVKLFAQSSGDEINGILENLDQRPLACMTLHRAETVNDKSRLQKTIEYCQSFSHDYNIVFPIHPNTKAKLIEFNISTKGLKVIEPQSYIHMQELLRRSSLILTDSGGLQKEAYFHKVRCVTLREETEWVELISHGWNRLWTSEQYECDPKLISEYGDGNCADQIINILESHIH